MRDIRHFEAVTATYFSTEKVWNVEIENYLEAGFAHCAIGLGDASGTGVQAGLAQLAISLVEESLVTLADAFGTLKDEWTSTG